MIFKRLRKRNTRRIVASIFNLLFLTEIVAPTAAWALNSGATQPEFVGMASGNTTDLVNPSTGDFSYNLPLLDVDGYPLNLTYNSGVSMDQEATWVGLGWNLSPGAIQRNVRGLPDDFNGADKISYKKHMKDDETYGVFFSGTVEYTGFNKSDNNPKNAGISGGNSYGVFYNSYRGLGFEQSQTLGASIGNTVSPSIGLDLTNNSYDGITVSPYAGLRLNATSGAFSGSSMGMNIGTSINSGYGIKGYNASASINVQTGGKKVGEKKKKNGKTRTKRGGGVSVGTSFGGYMAIGEQSYVPYTPTTRKITAFSFDFGIGGEVKWANFKGATKGTYIKQSIAIENWDREAYGYCYSENANAYDVMDFNRDKDGPFYNGTPRLPFAAMMYDSYTANAAGLSQSFRPYRNDLGMVHDPRVIESNSQDQVSGDAGFGDKVKAGLNTTSISFFNQSGGWSMNSSLTDKFKFKKKEDVETSTGVDGYRTFYFKAAGENAPFENSLVDGALEPDKALAVQLSDQTKYLTDDGNSGSFNMALKQHTGENNTNSIISYLTADEASNFGLNKKIHSYNSFSFNGSKSNTLPEANKQVYNNFDELDRIEANRKAHHFSELAVTNGNGQRYVYGLPVYNLKQKEVSFNASYDQDNFKDGLVGYVAGADNTTGNSIGMSNSFDSKEVPAHATSYLLTAMLSPDYVDITGDGPSPDDLGKYTKFNYTKLETNFKWRDPFLENTAKYNPLSYFNKDDDMGSYIYGEKEIWVLHSIETKNYVAEFTLSDRLDGYGVPGEDGGTKTNLGMAIKKLDRIDLYTRQDKINTATSGTPVPIKSVHFEYDYSLCGGVHNNSGASLIDPNYDDDPGQQNNRNWNKGKLTLKKVYYTYGNSTERSKYSPYEFEYGSDNASTPTVINPDYKVEEIDRWGNYKKQAAVTGTGTDVYNGKNGNPLANFEYTYADQNPVNADEAARAWNMTSIAMPSGSIMKIDYEADRYSYVQNRRTMKMFEVDGFRRNVGTSTESTLYDRSSLDNNSYIVIFLPDDAALTALTTAPEKKKYVQEIYFGEVKHLFFKVFLKMLRENNESYDFVTGYADIDKNDMAVERIGTTSDHHVIVKMQDLHLKKEKGSRLNPIAIAAFQYASAFLNFYMRANIGASGFSQQTAGYFKQLASDTKAIFKGQNYVWAKDGVAEEVDVLRSFVRLNHPGDKIGGGHRVKKITVEDGWSAGGEDEIVTGQQFEYELEGGGTSGVSCNEPQAGGEENPLRQPEKYTVKRSYTNNDYLYMEEPFADFLYPGASVVYSRVKSMPLDYTGVTKNTVGYTVSEFYTAKDFPIRHSRTEPKKIEEKPKLLQSMFESNSTYSMEASQGFILELNDMHGKMKSESEYGMDLFGQETLISQEQYNYSEDIRELDNQFPAIDEQGNVVDNTTLNKHYGKDVDVVLDSRFSHSLTETKPVKTNVDVSTVSGYVVPTFSLFLFQNKDERYFKSATINKVIMRYGILKSVQTRNENYLKVVNNAYLDQRTGAPILKTRTNRYLDPVYDFNYPSHWVYEGMGTASDNNCVVLTEHSLNEFVDVNGLITSAASGIFFPGDEVIIKNELAGVWTWDTKRYWVMLGYNELPGAACERLYLVDRTGAIIVDQQKIREFKIVRSGRRNHLSANLGGFSIKDNAPTHGNTIYNASNAAYAGVLQSSAQEYSENWRGYGLPGDNNVTCVPTVTSSCTTSLYDGSIVNPYIKGVLGNWRPMRTHQYFGVRNQNTKTAAHNFIPVDDQGKYSMDPFFLYNSTPLLHGRSFSPLASCNLPGCKWITTSEVTSYSPEGVPEEVVDHTQTYSSNLAGYNNTLIKAKATNARQGEIVSENFEDKETLFSNQISVGGQLVKSCADCKDIHFDMSRSKVTDEYAHTGKHSFKLTAGGTEKVEQTLNTPELVWDPADVAVNGKIINITAPGSPGCVLFKAYQYYDWRNRTRFSPTVYPSSDKSYLISVWVKQGDEPYNTGTGKLVTTYSDFDIDIGNCSGCNAAVKKEITRSKIIDGWQKFDLRFYMDKSAGCAENYIQVIFKNNGTSNIYIDDLRIQPWAANMTTSVYDPVNLRKVAELDENNYAIMYQFDDEGQMTHIRRETQKGTISVSESHQSIVKSN